MRNDHYILDADGEPQVVEVYNERGRMDRGALIRWAMWFEHAENRRVLQTVVGKEGGRVSTVFLALDHNFTEIGPPILWETMVFGGLFNEYQWRAASRLTALLQHQLAVSLIELYRSAPRRTKKILRHYAHYRSLRWPMKAPERRRLQRALARIGA